MEHSQGQDSNRVDIDSGRRLEHGNLPKSDKVSRFIFQPRNRDLDRVG